MFERKGRDQAQADGQADASLNLIKRPRPNLTLVIMFAGYRDEYLKTYSITYDAQRRVEERRLSNPLIQKTQKSQTQQPTPRDRIFE